MESLKQFYSDFLNKHTFNSGDLELLYERFSYVEFENIPEDWVVPIDEMLCKFRYTQHTQYKNIVKKVSQDFGQLIVWFHSFVKPETLPKRLEVVNATREKIYKIDKDVWSKYNQKEVIEQHGKLWQEKIMKEAREGFDEINKMAKSMENITAEDLKVQIK